MFREEHHGGQTTHAIMLPCGGCYESTSTEHRLKPQTPIEYSWPHQLLQIFTNDSTLDRLVIRDVRGEPQQRTRDSYWPSDLSEWHVLRLALQKNSNIKELWFSNNATTRNRIANVINYLETRDDMNEYPKQSPEELKLFLEGLAKNRCIKKLYLHECKFDSCMIEQIGSLLTRSTSVLELHINKCVVDCHDKGLEGLMTLSSYHTLFLNRLQIDDIGMATIINAIIEKKTETMANLDLSRNSSLGINTIASCAKLISNPLSNLRSLTMNESIFDDDKIRMIANALSQNKQSRLERLDLIPEFALPCRVTKVGWNAILEVLCSRSSIEQTYHSNHKLFSLGYTKEALLSSGSPLSYGQISNGMRGG